MSGLVEVRSYKKSQAWFSKQLAVMRRSVQKSESAWLQSWSREEKREKRKVYLEKQRSYARAVQRAKRVYEPRQRMKWEENAGSNGFWKSVRSIGLSNKGRSMANLVEVYDNQGEVKTGYDAVEVWKSHFMSLLGGETEQGGPNIGDESDVLWPTVCSGDSIQSELSSRLDMPILQEEVNLVFYWVRKEAAPGKDGISFK